MTLTTELSEILIKITNHNLSAISAKVDCSDAVRVKDFVNCHQPMFVYDLYIVK